MLSENHIRATRGKLDVDDAYVECASDQTVYVTENEVPWSRGKRDTGHAQQKRDVKPFCILKQPDERTTGAVGDVDGDGRLDVIVNVVSVGVIRDSHALFVKMKFETSLEKFSLDDLLN